MDNIELGQIRVIHGNNKLIVRVTKVDRDNGWITFVLLSENTSNLVPFTWLLKYSTIASDLDVLIWG